jgi:hypothetical protein
MITRALMINTSFPHFRFRHFQEFGFDILPILDSLNPTNQGALLTSPWMMELNNIDSMAPLGVAVEVQRTLLSLL